MTQSVLKELLDLNEAGGIVASFKAGYNDARHRHTRVKQVLGQDERDAKKIAKLSGADQEAPARGKAAPKPKKGDATPDEVSTVDKQAIADDITQFVDDFFSKFPNYGGDGGAEDIIANYPTKAARDEGAAAFKALAKRINELRVGFNKSLAAHDLVPLEELRKYDQQAKKMMGANSFSPPQPLVRFVKKESKFFKRLIRIRDNTTLNDNDFKQLLALKIKQTDNARVADAAQALNLLFGYMVSEFNAHSRVIADAAASSEDVERRARIAARRANGEPPEEE